MSDALDHGTFAMHALACLGDVRIPLTYRRVFELIDLADHTYDATAALLDVPIGTVSSRLFRARHRLRDALRAHHGDEE
jgi:DNA-directed RNA polymerase specialized sigma24 family protein